MRCGAAMRERGPLAAGEHRGHEGRSRWRGDMPDGIDALMNSVEAAGEDPPVDLLARSAELDDLPVRDAPALPPGELAHASRDEGIL